MSHRPLGNFFLLTPYQYTSKRNSKVNFRNGSSCNDRRGTEHTGGDVVHRLVVLRGEVFTADTESRNFVVDGDIPAARRILVEVLVGRIDLSKMATPSRIGSTTRFPTRVTSISESCSRTSEATSE